MACTAVVPPTVTWGPSASIDEGRAVFVIASEQRPRIEQSLRDAGLVVTGSAGNADYLLRVDVGANRAGKSCGHTNNVRYILSRVRTRILVLKARGNTGQCIPNVFDEMSATLESYFTDTSEGRPEGSP